MRPIKMPDFNELLRLAKEEPDALEALRKQYTEQLLASAPAESLQRLQGIAFVLDAKRRTAHSPAEACKAMSELMLERLKMLHANFEDIKDMTTIALEASAKRLPAAHKGQLYDDVTRNVVPFVRSSDQGL